MKDTKNITIALLCVSAVILSTVLVLLHVSATPAQADTGLRGGDYIMVTGSVSKSEDAIYIFDIAKQKLNVYTLERQDKKLKLRRQVNLKLLFKD